MLGIGLHPFGRFPDKSLGDLAGHAVREALKDAAIGPHEVEVAYFANAYGGLLTGQESIRGQVALREAGISSGIPIINVENACAGGSTAFALAVLAVRSGSCDIALAVGAEKMFVGDTGRTLSALATSTEIEVTSDIGLQFTAIYAMKLQKPIAEGLLTEQHLVDVAVKSHKHGALNPYAQFQSEVTPEQVRASRLIAGPLKLLMCSSISDGAAAAVVCSPGYARARRTDTGVRILASQLRSGSGVSDGQTKTTAMRAAYAAYDEAGLGPEDIDVVECHDATAPGELLYYSDLGFCQPDESGRLLEEGATSLGGRIPFNTGGGLTSRGHPVGATGIAQIAEVYWQLTKRAGSRQVEGARIALTQNSGGWIEGDSAASAAHIFER